MVKLKKNMSVFIKKYLAEKITAQNESLRRVWAIQKPVKTGF